MLGLHYPLPGAASPSLQRSPGQWSPQSGSQKWSCTCQTLQNKVCSVREQPTFLPVPLSSGHATCVCSGATGHSLSCSEHQFPIRYPLYNPSPHLQGTAPCIIPNSLNRLVKETSGWARSREKGTVPLLSAKSRHLNMGWAFAGWISGRGSQPITNHTTYPSSGGKRCGFPR